MTRKSIRKATLKTNMLELHNTYDVLISENDMLLMEINCTDRRAADRLLSALVESGFEYEN